MMTKSPTPTQLAILRRMAAADGTVRRLHGGYWVSGNPRLRDDGTPVVELGQACADVWADVRSIRAMEDKGFVRRTNQFPEEWRDTRELTDAGRAAFN